MDEQTGRPGDQAFEKLTAGLYLGDLALRILLRFILLPHQKPECLHLLARDLLSDSHEEENMEALTVVHPETSLLKGTRF